MKRAAYIVLALLILSACDNLFLEVKGKEADLQGKWQLNPADTIFFNFQRQLFQYQIYVEKGSMKEAFGYYTLNDDFIQLDLLKQYSHSVLDHLTDWETIPGESQKDTLRKIFQVDLLNSKKMVLSSSRETLTFEKF